jgi:hypothetical protein
MLSENAHVTPSLMLLGNTHCEVEVKKKNLPPPAFFFTNLFVVSVCDASMRRFSTFFSRFFLRCLGATLIRT